MHRTYLFALMWYLFLGFALSTIYGAATGAAIWQLDQAQFAKYLDAYANSFNCLISAALIIGAASFVYATQNDVPSAIEKTFGPDALARTKYKKERGRYFSLVRSLSYSGNFAVAGFFIFYFCRFPFDGIPEYFLIALGCVQYALGVYVGRKLFYVAHMLNSISQLDTQREILQHSHFGSIISYVNILSTLTVMFVYVHVKSYYTGPFLFTSVLGTAPKIVLLLPAIIATPVLVLFNFYPRAVLRDLYARSIEHDVRQLTNKLRDDHLSEFERRSYLIEYDRLARDEMRYRLQLSLSDLPMGVTIVVMIIGLLMKA